MSLGPGWRFEARAPGLALVLVLFATPPATAQGPNYVLPPSELETRLAEEPFQVVGMRDNRWEGDRTQRVEVRFRDGLQLTVKWAKAAPGGFALNNQPRYEVAAYEIQKLFLDESEWVVPPTVMREMALRVYTQVEPEIEPTFEGTGSVLVAVQYWLENVEAEPEPDMVRLARDPVYAHALAELNLLTYLIHHEDSNAGNILISTQGPPRLYAVDNGVAFRSPESPRGTLWADLHVDRLPATAIQRLRALTRAELESVLYVVAQFRVREDGRLEATSCTEKLDENRGVVREGDIVQLGLTNLEMDELWDRIQTLLERVDAGEIETY